MVWIRHWLQHFCGWDELNTILRIWHPNLQRWFTNNKKAFKWVQNSSFIDIAEMTAFLKIFIRKTGKVLIVLCLELFSKWQRLCRILWSVLDSTDSKRSLQIKVPILWDAQVSRIKLQTYNTRACVEKTQQSRKRVMEYRSKHSSAGLIQMHTFYHDFFKPYQFLKVWSKNCNLVEPLQWNVNMDKTYKHVTVSLRTCRVSTHGICAPQMFISISVLFSRIWGTVSCKIRLEVFQVVP